MRISANGFMATIIGFILLVSWLGGLVLAHGFWQTVFALIPFYSWYLVEKIMLTFCLV